MTRKLRPGAAAEASRLGLDWQDDAACKGAPLGLFFTPDTDLSGLGLKELADLAAERKRNEAAARRICASCPVRTACLEWRLRFEHQLDGGIWGGLDEHERWSLRKRRIRAAAARKRAA